MKLDNWAWGLIPYFALMILRYPLAIIAVLFFSTEDKEHLTAMKWLETIDWPLSGDNGWREEHLVGDNPLSNYNRIRWLWRNGGNTYNYRIAGVVDDIEWRINQEQGYGTFTRPDGYWLKRVKVPLFGNKFIQGIFGWNLFGPQQGYCKYVCTIRIKTKE